MSMIRCVVSLALALTLFGCDKHRSGAAPGEPPKATGPMDLDGAREYVLALVNRDRAEHGLAPVERDEAAERAAQRHAEDMMRVGFTAHWGSDGSIPEQRYTEAGGDQLVQENAACFFDGVRRELDPDPIFSPEELQKIESAFINEVPPNDGHRKNILKPTHNFMGVGLAKPQGIPQACMAQEFVDRYGDYDSLPATARVGQKITVAGEVHEPAIFGGVGLAYVEPAKPLSAEHLNSTSTYPVPQPYVVYFPAGFKTPRPVKVEGNAFSIEVTLGDKGRGRYEVSIWGRYPDNPNKNELVMIALRTVEVR